MIKKFLLLSLVASQLMISCSSDDSPETTDPVVTDPTKELTLEEEIAKILKQPYSTLTPAQQKVKLEAEANDMLVQLDKTKSSGAIEAIENLSRLLGISPVDVFNGKNSNEVEDLLNVSGIYGIYTWNNSGKIWVKTASTTELKFVFPAKASQTSNNASFSSKSVSSTIKIKIDDSYGYWSYDEATEQNIFVPAVYDEIFLPASADAVLTIDNKEAATFTQTAKYSTKNESPDEFAYKMTLNDGYVWEMSGKKGTPSTSKAVLTFNGKNLIDFNSGSTANIDGLIENDEMIQYKGKANGLIKLMDNFVILADMDIAASATDDANLEKTLVYPSYPESNNPKADFKAYYTAENTYRQKYSAADAANFNKNAKLILVSKKDGTKIADIVVHSEKSTDSYSFYLPQWFAYDGGGFWYSTEEGELFTEAYYHEVYYLKFNDSTEVEMAAYFSEGFSSFEAKFEEFVKGFERK
ncbi:hypothetical protein [Pseudomonas shirazensis]